MRFDDSRRHQKPTVRLGLAAWMLWLALVVFPGSSEAAMARDYSFDGSITSTVLENYLSRAVQCAGMCGDGTRDTSPHFEDDLRMVRNLGAKFIGRAALGWFLTVPEEEHYAEVTEKAARVHGADPEIILQACVFEIVHTSTTARWDRPFSGVDVIPVPEWVFEEFGIQPEKRTFRYEAMLFPDGKSRDHWAPGASVPDIRQQETRMWFYYRARRYIDAGYESIHFGQSLAIGLYDKDHLAWDDVLTRLRRYGTKHARRHYVMFDSHLVVTEMETPTRRGDRLLWDFASFPLRPEETTEPLKARLRRGYRDSMYGRLPGGVHPAGWRCEILPQLYEFDNCVAGLTTSTEATVWGADEATWFANLPMERRNAFLREAQEWIWTYAPGGHLQMPGRRPAFVPLTTPRPKYYTYVLNTRSPGCPGGFGQEETVKAIWAEPRYQDLAQRQVLPELKEAANSGCGSGGEASVLAERTLESLRRLYEQHGISESEL